MKEVRNRFGLGEDKMRRIMRELVALGYARRVPDKDQDTGRLRGRVYEISDRPIFKNPKVWKTQALENPSLGKPRPIENSDLIENNDFIESSDKSSDKWDARKRASYSQAKIGIEDNQVDEIESGMDKQSNSNHPSNTDMPPERPQAAAGARLASGGHDGAGKGKKATHGRSNGQQTTFKGSKYAGRVPDEWIAWAVEHGLFERAARAEAEVFTEYWTGEASRKRKKNWEATWRNWIRKHRHYQPDVSLPAVAPDVWRARLAHYKRTMKWSKSWGAKYGEPGCKCPANIWNEVMGGR